MTLAEKNKVKAFQDNKCGVTKQPANSLYLDHDHKTGLVRGLLSYKVNKGLGLFNDDPKLLRAAADYLDNPPVTAALGEEVYGIMGRVTKGITKTQKKKGKTRVERLYGPHGTPTPQPRASTTLKENKSS